MPKKKWIIAALALFIVAVVGSLGLHFYRQSQLSYAEQLLKQGDYQAVVEQLAPMVEGGSGSNQERVYLGKAYFRLGRFDKALQVLDPLLQFGNLHPEAVAIAGWIAIEHNSPVQAQSRFNQLKTLGRNAEAEAGMAGVALLRSEGYRQGELNKADMHLMNAESEGLHSAEGFLTKARFKIQRHQYGEAIPAAQQAAELAPNWYAPYLKLGEAHLLQKAYNQANEAFEKALEYGAPESETKFFLARSHYYQREFQRSLDLYKELSNREGPKQRAALVDQAKVHLALGQLVEAAKCLQKAQAIKASPTVGIQHYHLLTRQGRPEDAQALIQTLSGEFPYLPHVQIEQARYALMEQNYQNAYSHYQSVLDNITNSFWALYNLGEIALLRGDKYQAPDFFDAAARENPDFFPAQLNHALTLLAVGREAEAQPMLFELDQQFPNNSSILRARALERFLAGYPKLAFEFLEKAKKSSGENASSYIIQGKINLRIFHFEEARGNFERALQIDSSNPSARLGLAHTLYRLGEVQKAKEHYQTLVEKQGKVAPHITIQAQNGLAMLRLDNQEFEQANAIWNDIRSRSDLAHQFAQVNSALEFENTPTEDAISQLESAALQNQPLPEAFYNLALFHERLGNDQKAHESYENLLAQYPNYLPGLYNFAEWNRRRGRLSESILYYEKAAEAAPSQLEVLNNAAAAYMKRGDYEQAAAYLDQAANISPRNPNIEFNRAITALKKGEREQARTYWQNLQTMGAPGDLSALVKGLIDAHAQNWPEAQEVLGEARKQVGAKTYLVLNHGIALAKQGNFNEAEQTLRQAVQANPDIADTHRALGLLYCQMGLFEEAERSLRRSFQLDPTQQDLDAILTQIRGWIRP